MYKEKQVFNVWDNMHIEKIPDTLTEITKMTCSNCPLLKVIPDTMQKLEVLYIDDCPTLKEIPYLKSLRVLEINGSTGVKKLLPLPELKMLRCWDNNNLEYIVTDSHIEDFDIKRCNRLKRVHFNAAKVKNPHYLSFYKCMSLTDINLPNKSTLLMRNFDEWRYPKEETIWKLVSAQHIVRKWLVLHRKKKINLLQNKTRMPLDIIKLIINY